MAVLEAPKVANDHNRRRSSDRSDQIVGSRERVGDRLLAEHGHLAVNRRLHDVEVVGLRRANEQSREPSHGSVRELGREPSRVRWSTALASVSQQGTCAARGEEARIAACPDPIVRSRMTARRAAVATAAALGAVPAGS